MKNSEIRNELLQIVNIIEPEHSYYSKKNVYPIREVDLYYSYKGLDSTYYASCGPRQNTYSMYFTADKSYFGSISSARRLSIYVHEITHLAIEKHGEAHSPQFWRDFGFNAHKVLDNWDQVLSIFSDTFTKQDFIGYIIAEEINSINVDHPSLTVRDTQHLFANWFNNTLRKES